MFIFTYKHNVFFDVALVLAGANTMNDFFDWKVDSKNQRTAKRPIPSGLVSPFEPLLFALILGISALGLIFLLNI